MPPAAADAAPPLLPGAGALAATACVSGPRVMVLWLPFTVIVLLSASVYCRPASTSRTAARWADTGLIFRPIAGLLLDCMIPGYQGRAEPVFLIPYTVSRLPTCILYNVKFQRFSSDSSCSR
jgi:hypothetical protein